MTYFGFLALFVGTPIAILTFLNWRDARNGVTAPPALTSWPARTVIIGLIIVAVTYTTPWDNYLVWSRVWWYDPALVTGWVLGYVPIEEYTFFVVQTIMTGMWTYWLMKRLPHEDLADAQTSWRVRMGATLVVGVVWVLSAIALVLSYVNPSWEMWRYFGLEMTWALPPIMLQLIVGADLLWRHRRVVGIALLSTTVYLSAADTLAIASGTWTINPAQSLPVLVGGVLPIEELIFFFLTNTLVVFGLTLDMENESEKRIPPILRNWLHARKEQALVTSRSQS